MTDTIHKNTRVVAFGNQKGGVTKTSTVVNLAAALSERGKSVLVWDLDVNCGSTRLFGLPQGLNVYGTYEVMVGEEAPADVVICPGDHEAVDLPENVHLIAAHTKLEGLEAAIADKPSKNRIAVNANAPAPEKNSKRKVTVIVEDVPEDEVEDETKSIWRNRRPGPGESWMEPIL